MTRKTTRRTWIFGGLFALVILIAAIGGSKPAATTAPTAASAPVSTSASTTSSGRSKESEVPAAEIEAQEQARGWTGAQILEFREGLEVKGMAATEARCGAVYLATHYTPAEATGASTERKKAIAEGITAFCQH